MKRARIGIVIGLLISVLCAIPVLAAVLASPVTIQNQLVLPVVGIGSCPYRDTFVAEGRHWVVYVNNDTDLVYKSALESTPNNWSDETDIVTLAVILGAQYSVWYDAILTYVIAITILNLMG